MRKKKAIKSCVANAVVAAVVFLSMAVPLYAAYDLPVNVEAENCSLGNGAAIATDVPGTNTSGYSGDGFVWVANAGTITLEVNIPKSAWYKLSTRCWMYLGDENSWPRPQAVSINGELQGKYPIPNKGGWNDYRFGYFYLEAGTTATIDIGSSDSAGFVLYDTIKLDYANTSDFNIDHTPCDSKATPETKALKKYLTSVYGKSVLSGQQEIYGSGHGNNYELEFEYINMKVLGGKEGAYPAVRGFDMMNYNPLYGWEDGTTQRIIDWTTERGGIATVCWHINVPKDFTNYNIGEQLDWTDCTYKPTSSFNTANCLEPKTKEYEYLMLAIEDLAEQLLIVQNENIPVILRPFHEAQGNAQTSGDGAWFWWGSGGAEVYKDLWKLLYTTLTEEYGIHNVLWEVNLYINTNSLEWYPGEGFVDIVAYDKYEGSPYTWGTSAATSAFLTLVDDTGDTKMIAMSENDIIPDITQNFLPGDNEDDKKERAWWLYFCPWYHGDPSGNPITDIDDITEISGNDLDHLRKIYQSDRVIKLNDLPSDLYVYTPTGTQTPLPTPDPTPEPTPTPTPDPTPETTPTPDPTPTPDSGNGGCDGGFLGGCGE